MWEVSGNNLKMCEGDYGITMPITITGATFTNSDEVKITIKTAVNGETVFEKTFSNISQNTVSLEFTKAESDLLPVGGYVYALDWYQNGAFLCNIIPSAFFRVGEKA